MEKIVSNTTPIISLASIDKLHLLENLFGKIYIPEAVYNEIQSGKYPGYEEVNSEFFEIVPVKNRFNVNLLLNELDAGESEAIVVAREIDADSLIIDEKLAYRIARSQGLAVIGTLTVLLMAKNKGLLKEIKPLLDEMIRKGRWYSLKVYNHFLKSIGEL
ncbi:MAG: DUF3368 domain-containing protein [bacterium]|nr:DUF3368 domain-containing protein [bacterium]